MPKPQTLSADLRRRLRQQAHHLKPVVLLGAAGFTEAVLAEIDCALDHHELIKVRLSGEDREARDGQALTIVARTGAAVVQRIGHVASFYRPKPAVAPAPVAKTPTRGPGPRPRRGFGVGSGVRQGPAPNDRPRAGSDDRPAHSLPGAGRRRTGPGRRP